MRLGERRCAAASLARNEPMAGTASTVRSWLLLEHDGPWGRDAFTDARLPDGFGAALSARCRASGVRPLLIRRPGGSGGSSTCFAIRSGPGSPWIERTELDRLEDALEIDLGALGRGEPLGMEPVGGAVLLVCTHGRHDPCCAERGRPLALSLASTFPGETWETTHVGGDRFAGNLVAFPHGIYFGRVGPEDGGSVARAYLGGRVSLEYLRGRSCFPMAVQAAEHALRSARGLDRIDDVTVERTSRTDVGLRVTFLVPGGRATVHLAIEAATPVFLTCHSAAEEAPPAYRVLSVE
ncbi:MAG TPA: sucrase ferredoxin [Actinomycetota bacterium]|nr:sucrase ferredoxin [Actinomycetota bacterium]